MKFALFLILYLGMVSLAYSRRSAFLDELFDSSSSLSTKVEKTPVSCNATDTCAGKDATCSGNYNFGVATGCSATNGTCCADGLQCTNGTCQYDNSGASCSSDSGCTYGLMCNVTCQYQALIGDSCVSNKFCITGNCANGTCQGIPYGGGCSSQMCDIGLYCPVGMVNSTCENTTMPGGACSSSLQCSPGNMCFYSSFSNMTTTCMAYGSQTVGGPCMPFLCASGTVCINTGNSTNFNYTCQTAGTESQTCTDTANCTMSGSTCTCSKVTGTSYCEGSSYGQPCSGETLDLMNCLATSGCDETPTNNPDSCCQNKCSSEFKKASSCSCSLSSAMYGKCYYNQFCGGFPVWAIIVIIVVAIVLVLAIVLLVFFMMRRRRQYDSI